MAHIGYARISTSDQRHALQQDALTAAGCERVFTDTISGSLAAADRPGLKQAMDYLREGDTLVIYSLSRLGRKTTDVLSTLEGLHERGVFFRSVTENLDTSTPMGRVLVTLIAALAQMEREVLVERTQAGLAAARARGRVGGRPRTMTDERDQVARSLYASGTPVLSIASTLGVSKASITRSLARTRVDIQPPAYFSSCCAR